MKIRLHWKLTFIFCIAIALGLAAGYFYLESQMKSSFERELAVDIEQRLLLGRELLENGISSGVKGLEDADAFAKKLGLGQKLRVTVIRKDGTVAGDTDVLPEDIPLMENHLTRPEVQEAAYNGIGVARRYSYTTKKYMLYMAVPFGKGESSGFLRYAMPISYLEKAQEVSRKNIGAALIIVLALSVFFTFAISRIISQPLEEMAKIAKAMAGGDFSRRPSIYSKDEIGDLASALKYMADEINDKIEKIKHEGVKLDAVLSSMFEGIIVVDQKGDILLMNPSLRKLFFVDSDPEGKTPLEVIRTAGVQDMIDRILADKERLISKEISVMRPEEKAFKVNGVPIMRDGVLEGAVLVFHDITELKKLEEIRQDFVANVSHELRTPISSIKGYAETLIDGAIDDRENTKDFVKIIYEDSNRLANLIDDLLDLSRIESGKMKMAFERIELEPVLERALGVLSKTIKDKKINVTRSIPEVLPKVLADEKRLAQVFLNLLDNAVKYTPDGGNVNIGIARMDDHLRIDISDNGLGIPQNDMPRIFERFYRVDKARSREMGGTGLGLSIVKHIVLAHNGQVWAESEPGRGSKFTFTVPVA
ncbi:MAG: HAMP domain-containing protein [Candidatus Omnitrophica bacterium]|nr:HAMP domain-containing protein [Candidatus Omnitrophota bacterium]